MANRIKELRKSKNLTLKQLSAKTGISVSSLSAYEKNEGEKGYRSPKIDKWVQLADFFNVSISYLQGTSDVDNWENENKKNAHSLKVTRNLGDRNALKHAITDIRKSILGVVSDNSDELKLYFRIFNLLVKQEPFNDDLKRINENLTPEHYQDFVSFVIELLKIYLYSVGKNDKDAQSALKNISNVITEYEKSNLD